MIMLLQAVPWCAGGARVSATMRARVRRSALLALLQALLSIGVDAFLLPIKQTCLVPHGASRLQSQPRMVPSRSLVMMGRSNGNGQDRKGGQEEKSMRQLRVGRMLQSTLADVIRKGYPIKTADWLDDHIRSKISVVEVNVSPDLANAKVEVSIFGETVEKREAYIWLVNNAKAIRYALAQELKDFRKTPMLTFRQVDLGAGSDIFSLLDKLEEQREGREEGDYESGDEDYESGEEWEEDSEDEDDEEEEADYSEDEEEEEEEEEGSDDEDGVVWDDDEGGAEDGEAEGEVMSMAAPRVGAKKRRMFPPKVNIGGAGLSQSKPAWARVGEDYVPGMLERELAEEFAALERGEAEEDDDMWGEEDEDEEEDELFVDEDEEGDEEEDEGDSEWESEEGAGGEDEEEVKEWMLEQMRKRAEKGGKELDPQAAAAKAKLLAKLLAQGDDEEEEEAEIVKPKSSKKDQRRLQEKKLRARVKDEEDDYQDFRREGPIDMKKVLKQNDDDALDEEEEEEDQGILDDLEVGGEAWFDDVKGGGKDDDGDLDGWIDMDKILDEAEGEDDIDDLLVRMGGDDFFIGDDDAEEKVTKKKDAAPKQPPKGPQGGSKGPPGGGKGPSGAPKGPPGGKGPQGPKGPGKQGGGGGDKKSPKNSRSKFFYGNSK